MMGSDGCHWGGSGMAKKWRDRAARTVGRGGAGVENVGQQGQVMR